MFETVKYLIGSIGPSGYGSKSTAEQVTDSGSDLCSVTAIITGATSGIGAETARVLAKRGARLVLPARSFKAAEDAKARIVSEFPESEILIMALDLSSLNSVRSFVSEFESLNLPLNLLIDDLLCSDSSKARKGDREVLRGLQRSLTLKIRIEPSRSCKVVVRLGDDGFWRLKGSF